VTSILRRALTLLRLRFVLLQFGLALLVFLLFAAWLRLPDSSIFAVVASALLAVIVLAIALFGEVLLLRRLRALASTRGTLLRGAVAILLAVLIWYAWSAFLNHQSLNDGLRAGYWNSRFPHGYRNTFSYMNIVKWLGWLWVSLQWIGTGLLLAPAVATAQSSRSARAARRVWRSGTYWLVFFVSAILATSFTGFFLNWTPGHGLRVETISLALRLGAVVIVDLLLACFVLAVITALTERSDERYSTPGGTPETSQPRTTEIP
jgi:hypothetical protein